MQLEAHITVASMDRLEPFATRLGLEVLHIVLEHGDHVSQPMLSWRGDMQVADALERIAAIRARLDEEGYEVLRVKLEAPPEHPTPLYLEQHVKLRLADEVQLAPLAELGRRHCAHLSRNVRSRGTGYTQRFLTQRHPGPWSDARSEFEALVDELMASGYSVAGFEPEAVLLDTALNMDDGWLT